MIKLVSSALDAKAGSYSTIPSSTIDNLSNAGTLEAAMDNVGSANSQAKKMMVLQFGTRIRRSM